MKTISRTIKHDEVLGLEAFCLQGYAQPFPKHFHDYYVLGFVVSGERELLCNGLNLQVFPGNLLIFNPRDNHECVSTSRAPLLHYLGFGNSLMVSCCRVFVLPTPVSEHSKTWHEKIRSEFCL